MFLNANGWYGRDGSQHSEGTFLWVVLPNMPESVTCPECESPNCAPIEDSTVRWYCSPCGKEFYPPTFHPSFTEARAFVRRVHLDQCGQWMMGEIKVGSHKQTIFGAYGSDGLPDDAPRWVWEAGVPIPERIMTVWAKSTSGHNGPGDEAVAIRLWANENLKALRKAGREL